MKKLWTLKVEGVQIEEKRKTCFVSMKVFFSILNVGFSFISNSKTNIWAMKVKLMNLFDYQCE